MYKKQLVILVTTNLSVIRKFSGQNDLEDTTRAPSRRSANRSLSWWSTVGPKAKLFTKTSVDEVMFSRCSSTRKSPFISLYSQKRFPNHPIYWRKITSMRSAYRAGVSAFSMPMQVFRGNDPAICRTTWPTPEPRSINVSSLLTVTCLSICCTSS